MKKIFVLFLFAMIMASISQADLLVTANPIGQGKWGVLGSYLSDSNAGTVILGNTLTATTTGGYVGYGINEKLDILLSLGQVNVGNIPAAAGISMSASGYGVTLKYALLSEGKELPVSVAIGAGYKAMTTKVTGAADANSNQTLVAVGVSKVMVPFIPYGGVTYRSNSSGGSSTGTQLDLTLGSAIAWSTQGAVFVEYSNQSASPTGATSYTNGQIGLGVGYSI